MEPAIVARTIDPVNRKVVTTDSRYCRVYKGQQYYFCSAQNLAAFDRDPERYAFRENVEPGGGEYDY